jgi:hypothetical protein
MNRPEIFEAVRVAFDRGRWVLTTGADGSPREITIDLAERDDDGFDWVDNSSPGRLNAASPTDDHGPAIPAQDFTAGPLKAPAGPIVYEFALQDVERPKNDKALWIISLDSVSVRDAPDEEAAESADWVHVYDRVTRERRTLKRPPADRILTGLRDVAADLRRGMRVRHAGPASNGDTASVLHVENGWAMIQCDTVERPGLSPVDHLEVVGTVRGAPVEPPFGCAPMPPVGPLTSTDGLKAWDVLRVLDSYPTLGEVGALVRVAQIDGGKWIGVTHHNAGLPSWKADRFAFVARPGAWMPWEGGENPVGQMDVRVIFKDGEHLTAAADILEPFWKNTTGDEAIDRYMVIDTPPAASDT